jgi:hypothetical protein
MNDGGGRAYLLGAALVHLDERVLGFLSALPGQEDDDASLGALAGVDARDLVLPRSRGRLEGGLLRAGGWGCRGRVRLAAPLGLGGAVRLGAGASPLLALLGRPLLLLPGLEQGVPPTDALEILAEDLGCRFSAQVGLAEHGLRAEGLHVR